MNNKRSKKEFDRARSVIPGGVDSPVRSFSNVDSAPVFIESGSGSHILDIDGNSYIDYIGSWGPLILGHSSPGIYRGAADRLEKGITFGLPTTLETDLAEIITDAFPSIDKVRFVNSGTEAVMSALRLARGFTGRNKIIKFEGGYHGHSDSMLVKAGSGTLTHGSPSSRGIPQGVADDTLVAVYNDIKSVKDLIRSNKDKIAAIIIEPVAGNMGVVPPDESFLRELRELTEDEGILLIFDEVITGFRTNYGGVQTELGIEPDLTTLGKIIGGGLPVGAFGGREEIMKLLSPEGEVYQAGTLSGNPLVMLLGANTLNHLKENQKIYTDLDSKAQILKENIERLGDKHKIPLSVNVYHGMLTLFFNPKAPENFSDVSRSDLNLYKRFFNRLKEEGILIPPSQYEGWFLSASHTEKDIDETIRVIDKVLAEFSEER